MIELTSSRSEKPTSLLLVWREKALRDIWHLFLHFSSNEQEFFEIVSAVTRRIASGSLSSIDMAEREFFRLWTRKFHLNKRDALEQICLILLCELSWGLPRVSSFTRLPKSRVAFYISQALKRRASESGVDISAHFWECGRVDLYLSELVFGGAKKERSRRVAEILEHAHSCSRCRELLEASRKVVVQSRVGASRTLPTAIEVWLSRLDREHAVVVRPKSSWGHSRNLVIRISMTMVLIFMVVWTVRHVPYLGQIKWSLPESGGNRVAHEDKAVGDGPSSQETDFRVDFGLLAEGNVPRPDWLSAPEQAAMRTELMASLSKYLSARQAELEETESSESRGQSLESAPELAKAPKIRDTEPPAKATDSEKKHGLTSTEFFQWGAYSQNLESSTFVMLDLLREVQAIRAGELELGSEYKGGRYFHFEVPSSMFPVLNRRLPAANLSNFTSRKAKSNRKATDGYVRVVFLILPE